MSFINNPLGSFGSNPKPLGNLTERVEALQKSEIEKQIKEIATTKQQIRDDELWMLTQTPEIIDAKRASMGAKISEQVKQFTQDWANVASRTKGHPIPLEDKIKIVNGMRKVNETVADEKAFIEGMQATFAKIPTIRSQFKYDSQKKDFDMRVGNFVKRVTDTKDTPTLLDMTEMFNVQDRPAEVMFGEIDKQLIPLVDAGIKAAAAGQWTPIDEENVRRSVKAMVDGYGDDLLIAGQERGVFASKEQAADYFYNRVVESIGTKFRSAPGGSGAGKRKPMQTYYSPAIRSIVGKEVWSDNQEGVKADWTQPALKNIPFKREGESEVASGDFIPTQIMKDGWVEGSVKSTRKEPLVLDLAEYEKVKDELPAGGSVSFHDAEGGKKIAKIVYNEPVEETIAVPYTEIRGLVKEILPAWEEFYVNKADKEGSTDYRRSSVMKQTKYASPERKEAAVKTMQQEMKKEKSGAKPTNKYGL